MADCIKIKNLLIDDYLQFLLQTLTLRTANFCAIVTYNMLYFVFLTTQSVHCHYGKSVIIGRSVSGILGQNLVYSETFGTPLTLFFYYLNDK